MNKQVELLFKRIGLDELKNRKKLLFPVLTYLNLIILVSLVSLFVFKQITVVETIILYFLFFFLIRFLIRKFCLAELNSRKR